MAFETSVADLGNDLYLIDAGMHDEPERLACYLFDTPEPVLIEVGPSKGIRHIYRALESLGVGRVTAMVVTHIHFDHAGGAGHFAERFPDTFIGVHSLGAKHLNDPTRLWSSAERIWGEEGMRELWGPMRPVPSEQLLVLDEGDSIALGNGRKLEVMYTPGHAKHHVVFTEERSGGMFVGDSVGVAFPHGHMVQPVTPPPDFDHVELVEQLRRMSARSPGFVGFAHYGVTRESERVFDEAEKRLDEWVEFIAGLPAGADAGDALRTWVLDRYRTEGYSAEQIDQYDRNTYWPMQPAGIQRWLEQRAGTATDIA